MSSRDTRAQHSGVAVLALLGVVLVSLNLRTAVTSLSPLLADVDRDLGLGATGMGVIGMIPTAMFAVWGILAPRPIRRFGLERTTVVAMCLAGVGQVIRALAGDPWVLGLGSVLALSGMGIGNIVAPPLVKKYFPDRVPLVSMIYITGLQLGTVVPALVAVPVAEAAGWRMSIGWWAILAAVAVVPWLAEIARGRAAAPGEGPEAEQPEHVRIRPWRSPVGLSLALFFGTNSLCTYAFFTWLPKVMESLGFSQGEGGTALAVFSAVGLVGALGVPWIAGRLENPFVVVVGSVSCYLVGFAGLLWAPSAAPWLWVVLLGVGPSTFPLCLTLINLRTRTPAGSAALSGFAQGIGYAAASLGPLVFGWLFTGPGLGAALAFLVGVLAVMTPVAWVACRPRMLEDTLRGDDAPRAAHV